MTFLMTQPDDSKSVESLLIRTLALLAFALALIHVSSQMIAGAHIEWAGIGAFLAAAAVPYLSASVRVGLRR